MHFPKCLELKGRRKVQYKNIIYNVEILEDFLSLRLIITNLDNNVVKVIEHHGNLERLEKLYNDNYFIKGKIISYFSLREVLISKNEVITILDEI